ncbi:PEP-CTERM sorting domain-containing protein [Salinisphaera hydrothermalis]|nr:PEP-CTERM sorting domain-containing protein [Salinisphaera hydrothermalis]
MLQYQAAELEILRQACQLRGMIMKTRFYGTAGAIAALAFAGSAFASQIDINTAADGPSGNGEPTIYQIATDPIYGNGTQPLFSPGSIGPSTTQYNNGTWQITGAPASSSALEATYTANFSNGLFGVYDINDPSISLNLLGPGTQNGPNPGRFTDYATLSYNPLTGMFTGKASDGTQNSANFGSNLFGFFLTIGGNTYYSDPSQNGGDKTRMVGFRGLGNADPNASALDSEYLFGWEDGTDNDYQDYVVTVNGIRPVPEPSSIAMFGVGLLMIGFAARRLQKRDV